jgi:AraC family transcriptional regulator
LVRVVFAMSSVVSQFQGSTLQTTAFAGVIASETQYDYEYIDWHYHDNPYFSLITSGNCREINKRGTIDCSTDTVLFHNYHDVHCNRRWGGISRHFQIELTQDWCRSLSLDPEQMPASTKIENPNIKLLFYNIYREVKLADRESGLTIESLLLKTFETMRGVEHVSTSTKPAWVNTLDEILHDNVDTTPSLRELSDQLDLHPVHLSRDFSRYFRCNFSEYVRRIKVERALALLRNRKLSLSDVALTCGFADQSHFIRCFKEFVSITPKAYRKLVAS